MDAAGKLDRRVTIQRAATVTNALGEAVPTWADLATVWAAKQEIRDSERFDAQQLAAEISMRFRIRYSPKVADVSPKDRLIFEARTYDIAAVKEIGRREGLELTARARAD